MPVHSYQLRAAFDYRGGDNQVAKIEAQILTTDGWRNFELANATPGFLIFVYSFLICQHTYFHGNSCESGLLLDHADAELVLTAADDWKIEAIKVGITASLRDGNADPATVDYIRQRMRCCPVSVNLIEPRDYDIELSFS